MSSTEPTIAALSVLAIAAACGGMDVAFAETEDVLPIGAVIDWDTKTCGDEEQIVQPADPYVGPTSFRVYPRVQNESDHDFNSGIGVYISAKTIETDESLKAGTYIGAVNSLTAGATRYVLSSNRRIHTISRPAGFIRWGHDTPQSGECQGTIRIETVINLDPDLHIDGDPSNDDCLEDNKKYYYKAFMQECPR